MNICTKCNGSLSNSLTDWSALPNMYSHSQLSILKWQLWNLYLQPIYSMYEQNNQPSHKEVPISSFLFKVVGFFTGDMHLCGKWVKSRWLCFIFQVKGANLNHIYFLVPHLSLFVMYLRRTAFSSSAAGLDFPRCRPGHVRQQPSQWAPHHDRPLPTEPLVGSEWSAGYHCVHCVSHLTGTKQVCWHLLILIWLLHRKEKKNPPTMKPLSQSLPLIFPGATLSLAFTQRYFHSVFLT